MALGTTLSIGTYHNSRTGPTLMSSHDKACAGARHDASKTTAVPILMRNHVDLKVQHMRQRDK